MKINKNLEALVLASSLMLATTASAMPTKVNKAPPTKAPPPVCGEIVFISKTGAIATDLFTDCNNQADKCLTLLQRNMDHYGENFLRLTDVTTEAAARECIEKFEAELFGAE